MEEILERLKAIELDNKIIKGLLSAQLDALAKLKKPAKTPKIKVERVHKQTRAKLCAPHTAQIELDSFGNSVSTTAKNYGAMKISSAGSTRSPSKNSRRSAVA